jgi:tRNA threonylcarbamoyladenosine biosynthesis protein TsaE
MKEIKASLAQLDTVVSYLIEKLPCDTILFLSGDLASGKTTLTQAIAKAKGIEAEVTSPTFSLQQCYLCADGASLYHYDLYRLEYEAFMQMGLFEEFEKEGWHIIEWGGERLKTFLKSVGYNVQSIDITSSENSRIYRIETPCIH